MDRNVAGEIRKPVRRGVIAENIRPHEIAVALVTGHMSLVTLFNWIETTRENIGKNASDIEILRKTFERMK